MYTPRTAVWELTMGCNMRCKHCGSRCSEPLQDELNMQEALDLCDQLKDIGLKIITLSGGEPTTRGDWSQIASRLVSNGIVTSMITNGWLVDDEFIENVKNSGLKSVAISIDGLKDTHDYIRRKGSFEKSIQSISKMVDNGITASVITSINKKNINELKDMFDLFSKIGVYSWQLQMALPMGNFSDHDELMASPSDIKSIVDFAYDRMGTSPMIVLADCIGYYSKKSIELTEYFLQDNWSWNGCGAGKTVLGILHNGDIVGCTSVRNPELIAGNIRQKSLREIWDDDNSFAWNRKFESSDLDGFCKECQYSQKCKGGCSNSRYCISGKFDSENKYCLYNSEYYKFSAFLDSVSDKDELLGIMRKTQNANVDFYRLAESKYQKLALLGQGEAVK